MKIISLFVVIGLTSYAFSDYPIVSHRHLADPGALVYNGRVYIYCSNDDDNTEDDGYQMHSIVCVSSSDLKNWTDHGVVFQVPEHASWAQNSWAPSPAERDGKFYLYFGNGGNGIGVAVSDRPTGPFIDPIGQRLVSTSTPGVLPAENMWLFDPMTFIDDDGQAYMYFGGNGEDNLRVIKLNNDLISVDGAATRFHVPYFFEAAWMHKQNGAYYFSYCTNPGNGMRIDYMTSDNPISGFTYGGVLSNQPPYNNNNNHQAIFEFEGEWYQAYHNRIVAQQAGIPATYKRNLALDQFSHNEDGTIETLVNTVDGVEQVGHVNPYERMEAETMDDQNGIETEVCSAGGMNVTSIEDGDWIKVRGVDFGATGPAAFTAGIASDLKIGDLTGGSIEIRLDDKAGPLIGTVPVSYTGGPDSWKTETIAVDEVTGMHDVCFVFKGENVESLFNFDYWQYTPKTDEHTLLAVNAVVQDSKIDTVDGYNNTNITVNAMYTDGSAENITTETFFTFDPENIISISDSVVTGLSYGAVTVIAAYRDMSDRVKVVVKNRESELAVSRIYTDESDIGLFSGTTMSIQVWAEFNDEHVEDVTEKATYDNPKPEIVSVEKGVITALNEGEVDITLSYQGQIGDAKSTTVHVTVSAGSAVWLEPECAQVGENWEILNDDQASNGHYVAVQPGTESLDRAPSGSENLIVIPFTLTASGNFSIYARLNCPTYDDDSFWLKLDNSAFEMYNGLVTSGWEWIKLDEYRLRGGEHTLTLGYREDGANLDKICISNYDQVPEGIGGKADNLCSPSGVENSSKLPECSLLEQNYPNPFNPETSIQFFLASRQYVMLSVYNILGHKVVTLINEERQAGTYTIPFDASELSTGTYFYRLTAGKFADTKKFILVK
ncbi:MAG: family 43 glycosylhydrolase [candidate division KSB1 bacterium]|nr:family 43 glycosylhydrolase [candidate division KSB1 bacterium]